MSRRPTSRIAAVPAILVILSLPVVSVSASNSLPAAAGVQVVGGTADEFSLTYAGSTLWSGMTCLELGQSYAYCGMRQGLLIVDVTNQSAPVRRGQVYFNHFGSLDVAVSGDYAYLSDFSGLNIIDISNADTPYLKSIYETTGRANAVEIADTLALLADELDGLLIISVSDPQAPYLVASYDTPGISKGIYVRDTLVYIADWGSGVQIVSIADPQNPEPLGGCDTIGYSGDLAISGSFAYVAARFSGFQIVDVSDPMAPYLVGGIDVANYVNHVAVADTLAFLICGDWPFPDSSVQIVCIADPENPYVMAAYETNGNAGGPVLDGTTAYIADYGGGLHIVDVGDPETPILVGMYETPIVTSDVVRAGDYAYVSSWVYEPWEAGIYVVNVTDPTSPYLEGSCDTIGCGYRLAVADSMAYLVGYAPEKGLDIVNVADPQLPYLVTTVSVHGFNYDVTVSGDYAYLAGERGMLILDVSSPGTPVPVDSFLTDSPAYGAAITVVDGLAYLLGSQLYVINVTDPENLFLEGSLGIIGLSKTDIAVSGSYAYVTLAESELMIGELMVIDIDSAQAPTVEAQFDLPVEALGVQIYGDYAFVSTYSRLIVINISDSQGLYQAGEYTCGSSETAVDAGTVYVADWYSLLILYTAVQTCGDADASGTVDIDDAVYLIDYIFAGGPEPTPYEAGDVTCSGNIDIDDVVWLVGYIFSGGNAPCDADGDGAPDC